jgi:hypothetical protein
MIHHVSLLINGQEIVRHTGEWMKLYANLTFDANKRAILDRMVGNVPEIYDPANAYDRLNQYPHSISTSASYAEPSIRGRTLLIPLHFWFCETIGHALPLIALQHSEVEIVVELQNAYQLFTTREVRINNAKFGVRREPDTSDNTFHLNHFLSPPVFTDPTKNVTQSLTSWSFNPFIEGNFIFLSDAELAYIARTDHSFIINQLDMVQSEGQYGPSNDLELTIKNLVTRIIWVAQRSDRITGNDYDNYTNWENPYIPPFTNSLLGWYASGSSQDPNVSQRDILLESTVILDGQERFSPKQTLFFSGLQMYRHQTGNPIPGIYEYSFALDNNLVQPSGSLNGSMFNKTIIRNTFVLPPYIEGYGSDATNATQCVLKSSLGSANPVVILNPNITDDNGRRVYSTNDIVTVITKLPRAGSVFQYTYRVRAYVQSYNFLRIMGGLGNVVFSS